MDFKEKKWTPNGWYYDEDKGKWIPPDYRYMKDGKFTPEYEAEHGAKSPTGWVYDRDTMKWNPPKELIEENKQRWLWNPEKQIWIDLYKQKNPNNSHNRTWYPNGWYYDEKAGKWVSPDYRHAEINVNDPAYQAWKAEWKAARKKKQ